MCVFQFWYFVPKTIWQPGLQIAARFFSVSGTLQKDFFSSAPKNGNKLEKKFKTLFPPQKGVYCEKKELHHLSQFMHFCCGRLSAMTTVIYVHSLAAYVEG
jgi:hypothetical protein